MYFSITNLPAKYNIGRKVGEGSYAKVYIGTKNTPTALTAATSTMSGHLAIPTPLYHSHPTTPVTTPTATTPIGTPRATTPTPDAKVLLLLLRLL